MAEDEPRRVLVTLRLWTFHRHPVEIRLTLRATVMAATALVVLVVAAVTTPGGWLPGVITGSATLAGLVLGHLLQPRTAPHDISREATAAVIGLAELSEALQDTRRSVGIVTEVSSNARIVGAIVGAQDDLQQAVERVGRAIAAWEAVSPGAVDALMEQRAASMSILRKLDSGKGADA
ncbi:hypothetical protein [Clavibacter nebraskensis]|uniref:Uncharacterized protein n=1 Tax=Clavibacter nebraskensis TaxID=31963 RepID=A0A399QMA5_9MICO|nr:hypothetical protein [Clavibacter nebraskensis]RIJ19434.1 hypothetical protein DZF97_00630 [Clavibacter nebraskensis]UKF27085.1 hypothetical protein FGQ65_01890 [Clavibacter nebraskensis]